MVLFSSNVELALSVLHSLFIHGAFGFFFLVLSVFSDFTFPKFSETLMRISLSDDTASDILILFRQSFNSFSLFCISSLFKVSIILFLLSSRYLELPI